MNKKRSQKERDPLDPDFALVAKAFAKERGVSGGTILHAPGLRVKGKFFAFTVRGLLFLKLPQARVTELVNQKVGTRMRIGTKAPLKEWISIPSKRGDWAALAKEARNFVNEASR